MGLRFALCLLTVLAMVGPATRKTQAQTNTDVQRAVYRGVQHLRSTQNEDGTWPGTYGNRLGGIALAGLALRHGGVSADDPSVVRAADVVRRLAPEDMNTYDIALSIMFLDKMTRSDNSSELRAVRSKDVRSKRLPSGRTLVGNQIDDSELIVQLCQRLQAGQGPGGSWSYQCRSPSDGDHSNTQFGVLAVWVAGQHGVDVSENLARCDKHFRDCQGDDDGWAYGTGGTSSDSMTAAGLIALATNKGIQAQLTTAPRSLRSGSSGREPSDPAIDAALARLETFMLPPQGINMGPPMGRPGPPDARAFAAMLPGSARNLYFLWSLERVGVLYGLRTIGQVDWYRWGTVSLLTSQSQDGSWTQSYGPVISTSFAILFLTRANVAPELSNLLTGKTAGGGSQMRSYAAGTDPMQALGLKASVLELLATLAETSDAAERDAVVDKLAKRRPTYSQVQDQLAEILPMAVASDATLAQAARDQVANAFQRAPISHCLHYLGETQGTLRQLIWAQVEGRIARADAARRTGYRDTAIEVLGHDGFATPGRAAAIELLDKLEDPGAVGPVAEGLATLPRELWPMAGALLRELTGEDYGPRAGDNIGQVYEAAKQWQAWAEQVGDR